MQHRLLCGVATLSPWSSIYGRARASLATTSKGENDTQQCPAKRCLHQVTGFAVQSRSLIVNKIIKQYNKTKDKRRTMTHDSAWPARFQSSLSFSSLVNIQVPMYYGSGTGGRCCICAVPSRRCVCTHQVAALFCVKWRHGRHLESVTSNRKPTPSIDAYLPHIRRTFPPNFIPIWIQTTEL